MLKVLKMEVEEEEERRIQERPVAK